MLNKQGKEQARERLFGHTADIKVIKKKLEIVRQARDTGLIEYNAPGPFPKVSAPPGI